MFGKIGFCLILFSCIHLSCCQWQFSAEQTEVYDLVDEIKRNFYDLLNVSQDASQQEIRRSYRQLSRTMHPDKNKTEGAEENFRILVAVYEVLKNKEKREIYDNVLVNGLPTSYLYVPRRLRKMGMLEVSIIMALIITVGHFLFMWGSYVEKKLTLDDAMPRLQKRLKKKKKATDDDHKTAQQIEDFLLSVKPTMYDVLPLMLARKSYAFVLWLPEFIRSQHEYRKQLKEEEERRKKEKEEEEKRLQEELAKREEMKRQKKAKNRMKREQHYEAQKVVAETIPSIPSAFEDAADIEELEAMYDDMTDEDFTKKKTKKEEWTDEENSQLAKLMTKYPGGTPERWVRISREMGRTVNEITAKAKAVRDDVGNKSKNSVAVQSAGKLVTKKRHADKNLIPDHIISTAVDDSEEETMMQRLQNDKEDDLPSKVQRKQEAREIKRSLQSKQETAEVATDDKWDQHQQKLFEMALQQFPKSSAERWEKISKCVPEKTKEECIARYRFIAEKVQRKKQKS